MRRVNIFIPNISGGYQNKYFFIKINIFIPIICRGYQKRAAELRNSWRDHFEEQTKKLDEKRSKLIEEMVEDERCQARYQQTSLRVFAR